MTNEDVILLELTSGSTTESKLIPYTNALKKEFQNGLKPWIYNLYTSYQGIKWGKSYWSITPVANNTKHTAGGIPIGFEEDSEYFCSFGKILLNAVFALRNSSIRNMSIDDFYYETASALLLCHNLTFISVWNPTFLLLIIEYIQANKEHLVSGINKKNIKRGKEVERLLEQKAYNKLWGDLKVISCWGDANAEKYAEQLKGLFPEAVIQPKGLLATEGFISIPFQGENGSRISICSHFFEFISVENGEVCLSHQLKKSCRYSVVITTSGGLYRYKLNDVVEVTGFAGKFPLIKFISKKDKVSDLFGEKLNEEFLKSIIERSGVKPEFYFFAPETDRYVLYIKSDKLPEKIEDALRESFHYDYCRKLGQLKELRYFRITSSPEEEFIRECVRRGQRLGDIKPVALVMKGNWDKVFEGDYV